MTNSPAFLEYFDRIRIINLGSRPDRRVETAQEFASHGWCIDGDHTAFFDAVAPAEAAGFPNCGVRGCYLSHLEILESAQTDRIGSILVLEDDIAFVRRIDTLAAEATAQLDSLEWDLAYFGHGLKDLPGPPAWIQVHGAMQHSHFYAVNGPALGRLTDFLRRVLRRPPGHPDGGPMHYDGALSTFMVQNPDIRTHYFSKNLGYQRPSRTDLHPLSLLDRHAAMAPLRYLYRTLKKAYWHATR